MKTIDPERSKAAHDYINNSDTYTFANVVEEFKLGEDSMVRGADIIIKCPFHKDESPSCSLNDTIHGFNCLSCGRHGNYVKFMNLFNDFRYGTKTSYYDTLDGMLKSDPAFQAAMEFQTIYTTEEIEVSLDDLKLKKKYDIKKEWVPKTYLELSSYMKRIKASKSDIQMFVLLMQKEMPVEDIYYELYGEETHKSEAQDVEYDMASLLS